jgi:hypothetical protein
VKKEKTKRPNYTLEAGRCIVRDGVPIATISGTTLDGRSFPATLYSIGPPAALDDFARLIVSALNKK